jgi:hypothetical protein
VNIEQCRWTRALGWEPAPPSRLADTADLVLVFGSTAVLEEAYLLDSVRRSYPNAQVLGCSTGCEISRTPVTDVWLDVTASD